MTELIVTKLSHCSAPCNGGKEIILLCDRVTKDDVQVRFFQEMNGQLVWEAYADFGPGDVHKQVAICFRTPRYFNENIVQPASVQLQLRRPSDGCLSDPRVFQMLPKEIDPDGLARKRQKIDEGCLERFLRENSLLGGVSTGVSASGSSGIAGQAIVSPVSPKRPEVIHVPRMTASIKVCFFCFCSQICLWVGFTFFGLLIPICYPLLVLRSSKPINISDSQLTLVFTAMPALNQVISLLLLTPIINYFRNFFEQLEPMSTNAVDSQQLVVTSSANSWQQSPTHYMPLSPAQQIRPQIEVMQDYRQSSPLSQGSPQPEFLIPSVPNETSKSPTLTTLLPVVGNGHTIAMDTSSGALYAQTNDSINQNINQLNANTYNINNDTTAEEVMEKFDSLGLDIDASELLGDMNLNPSMMSALMDSSSSIGSRDLLNSRDNILVSSSLQTPDVQTSGGPDEHSRNLMGNPQQMLRLQNKLILLESNNNNNNNNNNNINHNNNLIPDDKMNNN